MAMRDLPDMYARSPRAAGPRDEGIHIRQIMNGHVTTISQTKTPCGCKKGAAKQSRINTITEYNW